MHHHALDRAGFLRGATTAAGLAFLAEPRTAFAMEELTPDEALTRLVTGNAKFISGALPAQTAIAERRAEVASKQHPFAMVLSCADSRIPVEHVFDQLIGDIFVCRVAGNIADPPTVGSFEYAIANFKTPAIMIVMGHQRCGAVSATVSLAKAGKSAPTSAIQSIVDAIKPAVEATPQGSLTGYAYADAVAKTNAKLIAKSLGDNSDIFKNAVGEKKLKIVPAFYSLDTGKVTLLG